MPYKCLSPRAYFNALLLLLLFTVYTIHGQDAAQLRQIRQSYIMSEMRNITSGFEKDFASQTAKLFNMAKNKGWKISETLPNGDFTELHDLGPDGTPIYYTTFGDNVSNGSRANTLHDDGLLNLDLNGEGMRVGVWDAGAVRTNHREFDTRASIWDNPDEVSAHATMVTGILIASGIKSKAKGVAYKANAITNDWRRDKIEVSEAAANGLLLSNHSYGIKTDRVPDWYFGSYIKVSQDWDKIMFNAPYYLMVTAAGNAQNLMDNTTPIYGNVADGFDLLLGFTTSKNGMTVTAADARIDTKGNLIDAAVTSYSSFGPIDDGRIKPDIAGIGSNIYSTNSKGNNTYDSFTGTSMATPGITGSMLLLQQYYERLNNKYMKAATLKGLVLHSADDVGRAGPDYRLGWGLMNSKRAAEVIINNRYQSLILEESIAEGETYSMTINAKDNEPLMVSISWTDPAAADVNKGILNDNSPALVNDLDIQITKDGETHYPWKLSAANAMAPATRGDNRVDPFEKVEIENATGTYTITITHKGMLKAMHQDFSLIVSGVAITDCNPIIPSGVEINEAKDASVLLNWEPSLDTLFEIQYKEKNTQDWITLYTDEHSQELNDLTLETDYEVRMRSSCTENIKSEYTATTVFTFSGKHTEHQLAPDYEVLSNSEGSAFSIYPNPTMDRITIDQNISNTAKYAIMTTTGAVVKKGNVRNAEIDVSHLSRGVYVLAVLDFDSSETESVKFYKN